MLKKFFICLILFVKAYAITPSVEELIWQNGESFLKFLENNQIPVSLYYGLEKEDQELAAEIIAGTKFQILRDNLDRISQILIPISEELQIHIYRDNNDEFKISFSPIIYTNENKVLSIEISKTPYQDIIEYTGNSALSAAFLTAFKGTINFKNLKKGDKLVIVYSQKKRLGRPFGSPEIYSSMVQSHGKSYYIYQYNDRFYDKDGRELENFFLVKPVNYTRISSRFTLKRWHPVLRSYRAHLGIDYAAPKGTKVTAAGDGVVNFVGTKGGYGKVVTIRHADNYMSLYAHLNGFAKGLKNGQKVSKKQLIGYVGNTGLSTGPHLHFGLYKNNKAINPEKVVKITKSKLEGKEKREFDKIVAQNNKKIENSLKNHTNTPRDDEFDSVIAFID